MKNTLRWFALVLAAGLLALSCQMGQDEDGAAPKTVATYTVTFVTSDTGESNTLGSFAAGEEIKLLGTDTVTGPDGAYLAGWFDADDENDKYGPGNEYEVTKDVTFVALWGVLPEYVVTYDPGEGDGSPTTVTAKKLSEINLPGKGEMVAPSGKAFAGWDLKGDFYKEGALYKVMRAVTFTAQWVSDQVSVTYETGEGVGTAPVGRIAPYGEVITLESADGMTPPAGKTTFAGWDDNGEVVDGNAEYNLTRDTTLRALWSAGTASASVAGVQATAATNLLIIFNLNGGDSCDPSTKVVQNGQTYGALPVPVRAGYDFLGWFTELLGGTQITANTVVNLPGAGQNLYAHWYVSGGTPVDPDDPGASDEFFVTFDPNYPGTMVTTRTVITVTNGLPYGKMPVLSLAGYEFEGWFSGRKNGVEYKPETIVDLEDDQTLYGHWKAAPHEIDLANPEDGTDFTFDTSREAFVIGVNADNWVVKNSAPAISTARTVIFPRNFVGTARLEGVTIGGKTTSEPKHGIELSAGAEVTLVIVGNVTVKAPGSSGAGIYVPDGASLRIVSSEEDEPGVLTATARVAGAGIGGYRATTAAAGYIEISGASLRVNAFGAGGGAGIGSGELASAGGDIKITGGALVYALGDGGAAGIGGGESADAATVTIDGGAAVVAVGGARGGPGIGGPRSGVTRITFGDSVVVSLRGEDQEKTTGMAAIGGKNDTITGLNYGDPALVFAGATYTTTTALSPVSGVFAVERAPATATGLNALNALRISGEPLYNYQDKWQAKMASLERLGWTVISPLLPLVAVLHEDTGFITYHQWEDGYERVIEPLDPARSELASLENLPAAAAGENWDNGAFTIGNAPEDVIRFYEVTGTGKYPVKFEVNAPVKVTVVLNNAQIEPFEDSPISLEGLSNGASLLLVVKGSSGLTAPEGLAGVRVPEGQKFEFTGVDPDDQSVVLTARGGAGAAGIGGDYQKSAGTIILSGGAVEAVGGAGGAGIGGGGESADTPEDSRVGNAGTIQITGGVVTGAGGANAAGIGGGAYAPNTQGRVTISGGTVTARGSGGGSGIGGGRDGSAGTVVINGGVVDARGNNQGSGIGVGVHGGVTGTVTISGNAQVTASSGSYGAGIGGGAETEGGTITITGDAKVTAYSGYYGAGIGGGNTAAGGTITISERATVTATGGTMAAGIGGGASGPGGVTKISGGTVYAKAGFNRSGEPAAIGGGGGQEHIGPDGDFSHEARGKAGTIEITGGVVVAVEGIRSANAGPMSVGDNRIVITGGTVIAGGNSVVNVDRHVGGIGANNPYDSEIDPRVPRAGESSPDQVVFSGRPVVFTSLVIGSETYSGSFPSTGALALGSSAVEFEFGPDNEGSATTGTITLNKNLVIPTGTTLVVPAGWTLRRNGHSLRGTWSGSVTE